MCPACVRHALAVLALAFGVMGGAGVAGAQVLWGDLTPWSELTPAQQVALAPLSSQWPQLSPEQQRNWMAVSRRYPRMTPDERQMLQDRMTEWATLTPRQRNQARFNFNAIKSSLSAEERRAKWEEYRALPEAEKERLAKNRRVPRGASPALRPPLPGQLVKPPMVPAMPQAPTVQPLAAIYNAPRYIPRVAIPANHHTLLPQTLLPAESDNPPPDTAQR